jgi:hypothetical protein
MAQAASLSEVGLDHERLGEVEDQTHDVLEGMPSTLTVSGGTRALKTS